MNPKWTNAGCGPRQVSDFNRAWLDLGAAFSKCESSTPGLILYLCHVGAGPSMAERAAKSVFGETVELDGWDSKGSPSWLLVAGVI